MFKWRFYSYTSLIDKYNSWVSWWFALVWTDFYLWDDVDLKWKIQSYDWSEIQWDISDNDALFSYLEWQFTIEDDYTAIFTDNVIFVDTTLQSIDITLPWYTQNKTITIKRIVDNANTLSIIPTSWTIEWETSIEIDWLSSITLKHDWYNWFII